MRADQLTVLKAAPDETRRYKRYTTNMAIIVNTLPGKFGEELEEIPASFKSWAQSASVRDISLQGLSYSCRQEFEQDALVEIRIVLGITEYVVNATVKRAISEQNGKQGTYISAVQFLKGGDIEIFIPALAKYLYRRFHEKDDKPLIACDPRIAALRKK